MAEALGRSNCGVARPRGKEAAVKPVSRRTEMPYQADGAGKLAPHSHARCSTPGVNGPAAHAEFTSLGFEVQEQHRSVPSLFLQRTDPQCLTSSMCASLSRSWDNPIPHVKQQPGPSFQSNRSFYRKSSQLRCPRPVARRLRTSGPEPWIEFAETNQPLRRFRRVTRPRKRGAKSCYQFSATCFWASSRRCSPRR